MAEVFAGFLSGYLMALITTPLVSVWLLRLRAGSELLSRLVPAGSSAVSMSVILHGALAFFWTGIGLVLGLVLLGMEGADGALGSLNAAYTLFVAGLFVAIGAPLVALLPPLRALIIGTLVLAIVLFGWLTPHLADWSRFDS